MRRPKIERLAFTAREEGSEQAILGLLGRFNVTYEHQMKDLNEKQLVFELLEGSARRCVSLSRRGRRRRLFARPLQWSRSLKVRRAPSHFCSICWRARTTLQAGEEAQILIRLAEYTDGRILPAITPCLRDFDEGIRYARSRRRSHSPMSRSQPARSLHRGRQGRVESASRAIAEAFHQRGWSLGEHGEAVAAEPPTGGPSPMASCFRSRSGWLYPVSLREVREMPF